MTDQTHQDPLLSVRRAISSDTLPTPTVSPSQPENEPIPNPDLALATHLTFTLPVAQSIPLNTPTRFISSATETPVDLRSIFFAWQKKDVAIPEYIASAQELNEALKQKNNGDESEKVLNLVFVERLDLITWLEGASDESEYIRPLEGAEKEAAEAEARAAAAAAAAAAPAPAPAEPQAGAGVAGLGGRGAKVVDPRLQEIYNGERKLGDRNSVLRGIKPTDFSHIRKTAESFLGRSRRTQQPKPIHGHGGHGHRTPGPSAGLPISRKGGSSRPDPIILLSPSASSLIRMSNVKSFLQDGVFVPPDHPTLAMSTSSNLLSISRPLRTDPSSASTPGSSNRGGPQGGGGGGAKKPTRFILVDSTANFRPDYWTRLVAVFTTGQTWQFKSYKWTSPPELFKHATGVYVGWRGEDVPREVKSWGRGVQSFGVERWDEKGGGVNGAGRWRDREVVEGIWMAIEEGMRLRGWGGGR